jgi:EAL and modified HD-GYP domain-containing signal transduction protein
VSVPAEKASSQSLLVGRQPILDRQQKLVAYELLFRSSQPGSNPATVDGVSATSQVLINTFNHIGLSAVLGDKKAFINVSSEFLHKDVIELLPRERVVLEILESVEPTEAVVRRCRALGEAGYELALDDLTDDRPWAMLLPLVRYVKIDLRALAPGALAPLAVRLRGRGPALLAEKVEDVSEFRTCEGLGFEFFQGYYFAKPEVLEARRLDPAVHVALELFNLTIGHADLARIENGFRRDVGLSYSLLRYINSVGMGLSNKVTNVRHALVVLGHAKLARWLSLLLLSIPGGNVAPNALFRTALTRARFAELLAAHRLPGPAQDQLFMTGMFSLLDALLGKPLDEALKQLDLPAETRDALLHQGGPFAPYLRLVLAVEKSDPVAVEAAARGLGLSAAEINAAQVSALAWAEQVNAV